LVSGEILHVKNVKKRKKDAVCLIMKRLVEGPAYPRDLREELELSRSAITYHVGRLVKYKIAKKLRDNKYAFISYVDGEEAVVQAVKRWKNVAFRYPYPQEIADETGLSLEEAERLARKTRDRTGWTMPNKAIKQYASEKLGEVLVCAARLMHERFSDRKDLEYMYRDDPETMAEAECFRKEHPEMLPKLESNGIEVASWPLVALKYLGKRYKPKHRHTPPVIIFR